MIQAQNPKRYDLEERTLAFAKRVNLFVNKLPKTITNIENGKQLVRAGGSTGANYIEANEALSKKDFVMRIKICRKESKECIFWLQLVEPAEVERKVQEDLLREATELMKIFGAILLNSK